jgi:UDP-glucose 4-epimerase
MKKVLVTGGFGFIGSHLIEGLLEDPNTHVHVVDNLSSNPIPHQRLLEELDNPERLTYTICSVEQFCDKYWTAYNFNEIYHLASVVGPAGVIEHIGRMATSIVDDTYNIIKIALSYGARLLDVSTSEVYGGGVEGYCSEDMHSVITQRYSARLEYAVAKLASEIMLVNTVKISNLWAAIVRPFNVAGPRQSGVGGFVLPRFVGCAQGQKPLTVYGDGTAVRAFTHVKDIVAGLMLVMEGGRKGQIYNMGNPDNKTTIDALAEKVLSIIPNPAGKVFIDPRTIFGPLFEEANDKFPDARKSMALGWTPTRGIDVAIRELAQYNVTLPQTLREQMLGKQPD